MKRDGFSGKLGFVLAAAVFLIFAKTCGAFDKKEIYNDAPVA